MATPIMFRTQTHRTAINVPAHDSTRAGSDDRQQAAAKSEALDRIGTRATFRRGQAIFYEGDPANTIYKVATGAVRTSRMISDGRRHVADFLFPGAFFGLDSGSEHALTAEALCDTVVVRYPRHLFETVTQDDRSVGRLVYAALCSGLASADNRMLLLGRKTAVEKIASFLLEMAEHRSADQVELPMPRADIADHLGLTIETVSRVFSQLKADGVIRLPDPVHVVLARRAALEAIADGA
jgi:CRP/FNR family nitrogen fixation transcriptional regulator